VDILYHEYATRNRYTCGSHFDAQDIADNTDIIKVNRLRFPDNASSATSTFNNRRHWWNTVAK
jgi:hypothetical protein